MKGGDNLKKTKHKIKQVTLSLLIIFLTVLAATKASRALFSDAELSQNTIALGTLNLQVGQEDPAVIDLDFSNIVPGETKSFEAQILNTGGINGNFWFEPEVTNSTEGDPNEGGNPEAETNIEGEGELDDCVRLRVSFTDPENDPVKVIDLALLTILDESYEAEANTVVDQMINDGHATMKIEADTANCSNHAMGDTVDLNLLFHLDQAN